MATMFTEATWDFESIGAFSITMTDPGGGPVAVSIPTGRYSHRDLSSVLGTGLYTGFAAALQAAIIAHPTLQNDYSVSWNESTGAYTILKAVGVFTLANPSGTVAGRILGRTSGAVAVNQVTSQVRAYYSIGSRLRKSRVSPVRNPPGLMRGGFTMGGAAFGIRPLGGIRQQEFTVPLEPKSRVYIDSLVAAEPWTWEHFWAHVGGRAYLVDDGVEQTVHRLRAEGGSFEPERSAQDYDTDFNINHKTWYLGAL